MAQSPSGPHSLLGITLLPSLSLASGAGASSAAAGMTSSGTSGSALSAHPSRGRQVAAPLSPGAAPLPPALSLPCAHASPPPLPPAAAAATPTTSAPAMSTPDRNPTSSLLGPAGGRAPPLAPSLTTVSGSHAQSPFAAAVAAGEARRRPTTPYTAPQHAAFAQQQHSAAAEPEFCTLPDFSADAPNRGDVRVRVSGVEFWVHRE
jgi:hypothetical protein